LYCVILLACLQLFNSACRNVNKPQGVESFMWLTGDWKSTGDMNFNETWYKSDENQLKGKGFTIENGDTLITEQLMIFASDSGIFYQASLNNQNDQKPILFKLIEMQRDSFVFFNPVHDFPKMIAYKKIGHDSLRVHVLENAGIDSKGFRITMLKQP